MRRSKKREIARSAERAKDTAISLSIEERLEACGKGDRSNIVYVGDLVERVLKGEFGAVLKALTAGRTSMELEAQKTSNRDANYHLGRLSMANDIWEDLEQYVLDKDKLLRPSEQDLASPVTTFNYSPDSWNQTA